MSLNSKRALNMISYKLHSSLSTIVVFLFLNLINACAQNVQPTNEPSPSTSLTFQRFLPKHGGKISSTVYSSDGKMIATGSDDSVIRISDQTGKIIRSFTGHYSGVNTVAISPDDKMIVSTSFDSTAILWNINGEKLKVLKDEGAYFNSIVFSPDGKTFLTSSTNKTAKIWNLKGDLLATFKGHSKAVKNAIFSPDGQTVLTASYDQTAKLWSLDGQCTNTFNDFTYSPTSIAFSPDGKTVLIGRQDYTCQLLTLDGKLLQTFPGRIGVFSPDGNRVVTGQSNRKWILRLWDLKGNLITGTRFITSNLTSILFSPNGKNILTASRVNTYYHHGISIFNLKEQDSNTIFPPHNDLVYSMDYAKKSNCILTGSADSTAALWSINGKKLQHFSGHQGAITKVAFSPDEKMIATASYNDKTLKLWSIDGKLLHSLEPHKNSITSFDFSPDGKYILTSGGDKQIKLWTTDLKLVRSFQKFDSGAHYARFNTQGTAIIAKNHLGMKLFTIEGEDMPVPGSFRWLQCMSPLGDYHLANNSLWDSKGQELQFLNNYQFYKTALFLPDHKGFLLGTKKGIIEWWSFDGQKLKTYKGHTMGILQFLLINDDQYFLSLGEDQTIRKWKFDDTNPDFISEQKNFLSPFAVDKTGKKYLSCDTSNVINLTNENGKVIQTLNGHNGYISDLTFSSNGKYILTGSYDDTAIIWDKNGNQKHMLAGHTDNVFAVAFSPDGKKVLTGSRDGTAKLWSVKNGQMIQNIMAHERTVFDVAFAPDGKSIFTCGGDHVARQWQLDGKLIQTFEGQEFPIHRIDVSPDGQSLLTAGKSCATILWNLKGAVIHQFDYPSDQYTSARFSPDGKYLANVYKDVIKVYDLKSKKTAFVFKNETSILGIAFSPDSKRIIFNTSDKVLQTWDLTLKPTLTVEDGGGYIGMLPDKQSIFLGGSSFYKTSDLNGKILKHYFKNSGLTHGVSPDGEILLKTNNKYKLELSNMEGNVLHTSRHESWFATFSNNGKYIAATNTDHTFLMNRKGEIQLDLRVGPYINFKNAVTFSSDDQEFLVADTKGSAFIFDLNGNRKASFLGDIEDRFSSVAYSPDEKTIWLGTEKGVMTKWNREGELLDRYQMHHDIINKILFSPDGRFVLTCSSDWTAKLWDLKGNLLKTFPGNNGTIKHAIFLPDGDRIILSATSGTTFWNLER